jgi:drug/metabolite transporter (DMT)-like permease
MTASLRISPRDWLEIAILALFWAGSFVFIRIGVAELPPFTFIALRIGIAFSALYIYLALARKLPPLTKGLALSFLVMGLLNNAIPFALYAWAQTRLGAGLTSIFNAMTPLFTLLVAHWLTSDDRMTPSRIAALVLGFAGIVALVGPDALKGLDADFLAEVGCILATVSYAFSGVYGRRFHRMGLSPVVSAAGQLAGSFVLTVPLSLAFDQPWHLAAPSPLVWGAVVAAALISTSLGYILYFRILATAGATNASLVTFLIPPFAIMLGAVLFAEHLEANQIVGMVLILLGLVIADGRFAGLFRRA